MNNRGFSLLEILIALSVMLVGVVGIMNLFPVGLRASKVGENYTLAAILAQYSIDEAKLTSFAGLGDNSGTFASPDNNFSWTRTVTTSGSNLQQITVRITWSDLGTSRYEDFVTYRANY